MTTSCLCFLFSVLHGVGLLLCNYKTFCTQTSGMGTLRGFLGIMMYSVDSQNVLNELEAGEDT